MRVNQLSLNTQYSSSAGINQQQTSRLKGKTNNDVCFSGNKSTGMFSFAAGMIMELVGFTAGATGIFSAGMRSNIGFTKDALLTVAGVIIFILGEMVRVGGIKKLSQRFTEHFERRHGRKLGLF